MKKEAPDAKTEKLRGEIAASDTLIKELEDRLKTAQQEGDAQAQVDIERDLNKARSTRGALGKLLEAATYKPKPTPPLEAFLAPLEASKVEWDARIAKIEGDIKENANRLDEIEVELEAAVKDVDTEKALKLEEERDVLEAKQPKLAMILEQAKGLPVYEPEEVTAAWNTLIDTLAPEWKALTIQLTTAAGIYNQATDALMRLDEFTARARGVFGKKAAQANLGRCVDESGLNNVEAMTIQHWTMPSIQLGFERAHQRIG